MVLLSCQGRNCSASADFPELAVQPKCIRGLSILGTQGTLDTKSEKQTSGVSGAHLK